MRATKGTLVCIRLQADVGKGQHIRGGLAKYPSLIKFNSTGEVWAKMGTPMQVNKRCCSCFWDYKGIIYALDCPYYCCC